MSTLARVAQPEVPQPDASRPVTRSIPPGAQRSPWPLPMAPQLLVTRPEPAAAVVARPTAAGLCVTCALVAECSYWPRHDEPVWNCESFDDREAAVVSAAAALATVELTAVALATVAAGSTTPSAAAEMRGLCGTCDLVESCRLPRAASGVWSCEEYR